MNKNKDIERKDMEPVDFGTEGRNRPKPTLERAKKVDTYAYKLSFRQKIKFYSKRAGNFVWAHKKKAAAIIVAALSPVINLEPVATQFGLLNQTDTGGIMDIVSVLSSTPGIVMAVLIVVGAAGYIYEAYKGKKLKGVVGKVVDRSGEAAKELYRAMGEESPGGKRVLPKEWLKVGEEFIQQEKDNDK